MSDTYLEEVRRNFIANPNPDTTRIFAQAANRILTGKTYSFPDHELIVDLLKKYCYSLNEHRFDQAMNMVSDLYDRKDQLRNNMQYWLRNGMLDDGEKIIFMPRHGMKTCKYIGSHENFCFYVADYLSFPYKDSRQEMTIYHQFIYEDRDWKYYHSTYLKIDFPDHDFSGVGDRELSPQFMSRVAQIFPT